MSVHRNSIAAYKSLLDEGKLSAKEARVLKVLGQPRWKTPPTANELQRVLGRNSDGFISQIRATLFSLREKRLVVDAGDRECRITHRVVTTWRLAEVTDVDNLKLAEAVRARLAHNRRIARQAKFGEAYIVNSAGYLVLA